MNSHDPSGMLLIDKPAGISSFDIIRKLRTQTGLRKFGHAGTLDPAATGLMIILVGSATKQATKLIGLDKTYIGEITLGLTSSTGDREGELSPVSDIRPSQTQVIAALASFKGEITQTPSQYSAIKIRGQEAYKRARKGEKFEMPSRVVQIRTIELLSYIYPKISFCTEVSSGTYIRSLAADIGSQLGTGAYLSALKRTTIGPYQLEQAHTLDQIDASSLNNYLMKFL